MIFMKPFVLNWVGIIILNTEVYMTDKKIEIETCQQCKLHNNNPSFCRKHNKFVSRKTKACVDMKR